MEEKEKPKETTEISWVLNGETLSGEWSSTDTLLAVLRRDLKICSVKEGCEQGECGSCTVLINEEPVLACQITMADVAEQQIQTWEGMPADIRRRHAQGLSKAGLACGFCVPGMLLRWHALSTDSRRPSREQILSLLSHHYCRCTGYVSWLYALQQMSLLGARRHMPTISLWNHSELQAVSRLQENVGALHLLGRLLAGEPYYVDDLTVPHMLEAALAFVPQAFGEIDAVNLDDALGQQRAEAILSAKGLCQIDTTQSHHDTVEVDLGEAGERFFLHTLDSLPLPPTLGEIPTKGLSIEELTVKAPKEESLWQMQGGVSPTLESFVGLVSFQDWSTLEKDTSVSEVDTTVDTETWDVTEGVDKEASEDASAQPSDSPVDISLPGSPSLLGPGHHIRSCGDIVAVTVASRRDVARAAARAIKVEVLEDEEPTFDAEYAAQRGWEDQAAVLCWESGDVSAIFREAHAVVSGTWTTSSVDAGGLEPPSCLVVPLRDGRLKVYAAGRSAVAIRSAVARAVNKELAEVEVSLLPTGGSFDTRLTPLIEPYAATMAVALGRPVKLTLSRDDISRLVPKRHACRIHMSMACDEQGRIQALRMDFLADTGGLAQDAELVLRQAMAHAFGPYRVPAFLLQGKMLCSNLPNAGAVVGDGVAQVCFALESLVDMMAHRLGIDGWVFRYSNILEPGDMLPNGYVVGPDCRAKQTLEAVRDLFYKNEEASGLACSWMGCDEFSHLKSEIRVALRIDEDERCHIMLPRGDCGQNLYVRVLQVVSHESGLAPDMLVLDVGTTHQPHLYTSSSSSWGILEAARRAAQKIKAALLQEKPLAHQEFVGVWKWHESLKTPLTKEEATPSQDLLPVNKPDFKQMPLYRTYSFAAQLAILHPEHGTLRRIVTACDLGHPSFPTILAQQIEGAVHAGLGYALQEEFPTEEGMPLSSSLRKQGSLSPEHTPHLQTILVTDPPQHGGHPTPEKGEGELAMFGVAPAVASAIYRLQHKRYYNLPMKQSDLAVAIATDDDDTPGS